MNVLAEVRFHMLWYVSSIASESTAHVQKLESKHSSFERDCITSDRVQEASPR